MIKFWDINTKDLINLLFSPYHQEKFDNFLATSIIVGEYDGLRNDLEAYYQRLKIHGANVEKTLSSGQTHNTILMRKMMSEGEISHLQLLGL